ncbi:MAG: glycosyltransferase family 1 protein [Elusimicrobiota bacterium]
MIIGVNASLLDTAPAGIGTYIYEMFNEIDGIDDGNTYILYGGYELKKFFVNPKRLVIKAEYALPRNSVTRIIWEQTVLPVLLKRDKVDVLFCTDFSVPYFWAGKLVVTIYDLSMMVYPEVFTKGSLLYKRWMVPYAVKKADRIVTISQSTVKDIVKFYYIQPDKMVVAYPGARNCGKSGDTDKHAVLAKYGITGDIVLGVSSIEPRKNFVSLLKAYAALPEELKLRYKLLIAGQEGWLYNGVYEECRKLNLDNYVVFTGYLEKAELYNLYSAASVFVYPSLYEGFGMPVAEAMANGCPVIASNTSSLPEVVGDAGIMVDPLDVQQLTIAMSNVLNNSVLRSEMVRKGYRQAEKFNWHSAAVRVVDSINKMKGNI